MPNCKVRRHRLASVDIDVGNQLLDLSQLERRHLLHGREDLAHHVAELVEGRRELERIRILRLLELLEVRGKAFLIALGSRKLLLQARHYLLRPRLVIAVRRVPVVLGFLQLFLELVKIRVRRATVAVLGAREEHGPRQRPHQR